METLGLLFLGLGVTICIVCGIFLMILAFKESILWGVGYLFIPLVALLFVVVHWDKAKEPFLISLLSIPCFIIIFVFFPEVYG